MVQNLRVREDEGMRGRFVFDMLLPVAVMHWRNRSSGLLPISRRDGCQGELKKRLKKKAQNYCPKGRTT
jgi:hypothetical protein